MKQMIQNTTRSLATLLLLLVALLMPQVAHAQDGTKLPDQGNGTSASPYEITCADELYWFAQQVNGGETSIHAVLTQDIVVNEGVLQTDGSLSDDVSSFRVWTPIGNGSKSYKGTFDGQGHTISGLYVNETEKDNVGLFGITGDNAKVMNVGVVDNYFFGSAFVGGVCGVLEGGTITNCYNAGSVNGNNFVGGVCGDHLNGTLTNCYNTGSVGGKDRIGGVCGVLEGDTITNCYNAGSVNGNNYVGGVCGLNFGTLTNCYYLKGFCPQGIGEGSGAATEKTADQFAKGEVCWLLNGSKTNSECAWRQNLGRDALPVLDGSHGKVYYHVFQNCQGVTKSIYSNNETILPNDKHDYGATGFCTACGESQPATYNKEKGVYAIANAGQLHWFAQQVNGGETNIHAVLTADITLTGNTNDYVIGTYEHAFAGVFDGDGHTISGVNVTTTKKGNKGYLYAGGLFGIINAPTGTTAEVKNLTIEGLVDITVPDQVYYIGGVIGIAYGTVKMGHITSRVNLTIRDGRADAHCGGIVASGEWFSSQDADHQSTLYLSHCANYGTLNVSCKETCGGIIGFINNGAITDCLNAGDITNCLSADNTTTAGILGYVNSTNVTMSRCLNVGAVQNTQTGGKTYSVYYADNGVIGSVDGLYFKSGTATSTSANTTAVTEEQLKSGEVCWLLNGGTAEGDIAWRQDLGSDAHPVLDTEHKLVFYGYKDCQQKTYGNDKDAISDTPQEHAYENGFCSVCGEYQQATKNADDVYEIANAGQLYWFAGQVNGGQTGINGMLVDNIVVNKDVLNDKGELKGDGAGFRVWTPIGDSSTPYEGTFDGQGHTISGLYLDDEGRDYVGLFGNAYNANIENVGVVDSYFRGQNAVGGVCGGGAGSIITKCHNAGTVKGFADVGGVCGHDGVIVGCHNTGAVSGDQVVGGVCGYNGTIFNCYNTGAVSGDAGIGGVCGGEGTIINSYNTGAVSGDAGIGGVCGSSIFGHPITNCYYLKDRCPQGIGNGSGEATEKTEDQFKSGEVTWLLNEGTVDGEVAWRQNLGSDASPVLDSGHAKVYFGYKCLQAMYSNDPLPTTPKEHAYDNGFCLACGVYQPATKNADDVYEIANAGQLYWFAGQVNSVEDNMFAETFHAVLTDDIVVNTGVLKADGSLSENDSTFRVWTPIGNNGDPYKGTFDGQGHTIGGLYFNDKDKDGVGLFGHIKNGAEIMNVGVVDSYFHGNANVGGVCGEDEDGTLKNCYNTGTVSGKNYVGGVCGTNNRALENCYNTGAVSGKNYVGGVCAYQINATLTNCYNTGTVSGTGDLIDIVGGVCGDNFGTITNCYNTGMVIGKAEDVGSICGRSFSSSTPIMNCYYLKSTCAQGIGRTNDGSDKTIAKTADLFKSGEVCWLLDGGTAEGDIAWRQTLGSDASPVLDSCHAKVYFGYKCLQEAYSNDPLPTTPQEHTYDNGFCTACGEPQPATYNDEDGFYEIANAGQLYWFAEKVNAGLSSSIEVRLMADIDATDKFIPIGTESNRFIGTFDGQGHAVTLNINNNDKYQALIGHADGITVIKDVTVKGSITCSQRAAGIVGGMYADNKDGKVRTLTISRCANYANVTKTGSYTAGGILGINSGSTVIIEDCLNAGNIHGKESGGIAGWMTNSKACIVRNCLNVGTITGGYYTTGIARGSCTQTNNYTASNLQNGELESGEVCWKLNGSVASEKPTWRQTIGEDGDAHPVLEATHGIVVYSTQDGLNSIVRPTAGTLVGARGVYNFAGIEGRDVYGIEHTGTLAAGYPYVFTTNNDYVSFVPSDEEVTDDTPRFGLTGVLDPAGVKVYGKDDSEDTPVSIVFTADALNYANPEGDMVKYGKCYINADECFITSESVSAMAKSIAYFGNGGTTSINEIDATAGDSEGKAYNLQGVEVGKDYKGVVIVNGKKMVRK